MHLRALKRAVQSFRSGDETASLSSFRSERSQEEIDIGRMKQQLAQLQEALMDAPESERKAVQKKVKELQRALKAAVRQFRSADETSSAASSEFSQDLVDIEKMKKELARLQEMQMDASEADKKALSQQIRNVKK